MTLKKLQDFGAIKESKKLAKSWKLRKGRQSVLLRLSLGYIEALPRNKQMSYMMESGPHTASRSRLVSNGNSRVHRLLEGENSAKSCRANSPWSYWKT